MNLNPVTKVKELNRLSAEIPPLLHYFLFFLTFLYVCFFISFSLLKDIPLPGEFLWLIVAMGIYLYRRTPPFIKIAVFPFVILGLAYRFTTSIVGEATHVHIQDVIAFEHHIIPFIPAIKLQSLLFTPGRFHWYDAMAAVFYFAGLGIPYVIGIFLLLRQKMEIFQKYLLGMFMLNFMGFVTYLLYPAMPPWLASTEGYLPPISRILLNFYQTVGLGFINNLYSNINQHPTAAVPSMHMAFVVFPALYLSVTYKWKGALISAIACLGMLFTVLYLGEHYLFDAIIGSLYAVIAFAGSTLAYRTILHISAKAESTV